MSAQSWYPCSEERRLRRTPVFCVRCEELFGPCPSEVLVPAPVGALSLVENNPGGELSPVEVMS